MSRFFEALSRLKAPNRPEEIADSRAVAVPDPTAPGVDSPVPGAEAKIERSWDEAASPAATPVAEVLPEPVQQVDVLNQVVAKPVQTLGIRSLLVNASPESRLVSLIDPSSLGAEKYRALVTRFDHLSKERELKSFQVTSSLISEGKTTVAGNVAITLARYLGDSTLLVEGDLHRPALASMLGLIDLPGINDWWSGPDRQLAQFIHRLNEMPLWFLASGKVCDQPSDVLRSARFRRAFTELARQFEWIVVDSPPMLPVVDINLWSRLLSGTLLVVREGVTPIKALRRALQALDHPNLIGVVVNDAKEFDHMGYEDQYYGATDKRKNRPRGNGSLVQ
jgi:capsular exopolysaccharide synthesis family protein